MTKTVLSRRLLYFAALAIFLFSCSTKKNTVVSRGYHNLTARFNGYYYSTVNLQDGIFKIEKGNKENYDKIIPVYVYPTQENVKSTFGEFDKAIKKSSLCIQKHAIKDKKGSEIPSAGKWIDNNWINIGIAHFYKREFFSAIEAFEYVARTYNKSDDKFTAILWLIKANNEIGSVSTSETYLSLLKNERALPASVKREFPVAYADYYIRRGQYTEAVARLMEATRNKSVFNGISKGKRARFSFIVAQLSERLNDNQRAIQYYNRVIRLKPSYEMTFYSKIKIARLQDPNKTNINKIKKDLLKMAKEFKNSDYYDVIYYTLGEIEEKQKNIAQAITYYNLSVRKSVNNKNQKGQSFLKLAEINFDQANYQPAEAYYDSTIASLPKDHPDYENIIARKKTLESLVTQIRTIQREDSLQKIAKLSEEDRNRFIDKMIEKIEKDEERKRREQELAAAQGGAGTNTFSSSVPDQMTLGGGASFYFYNPTTVSFGVTDFIKRWGNSRKNEDNWRRSSKALSIEDPNGPVITKKDSVAIAKRDSVKKEKTGRAFYLKDLPLNDSLVHKSNRKILRAYYVMGGIYKEELHNYPKSIAAYEELNRRFPDNTYQLKTYYTMYRIYLEQRNTAKADFYKNKILNEFPDSEFAQLIKNPEYAQELNARKSEVEDFYVHALDVYRSGNYSEALQQSKQGLNKFGKTDYSAKFDFIRSVSDGKLKGTDSLEKNLKMFVTRYPSSEVTPLAQDILAAIKKQKTPEVINVKNDLKAKADTFSFSPDRQHFVIAIMPDDIKMLNGFKTNIVNFNTIFFNDKKFEITSNLFGSSQMVMIKSFPNAKDALTYYENVIIDQDVFKGDVKKDQIEVLPISTDNLPVLYKSKNVAGYKAWFTDNYKNLNTRN